MTVVDRQALFSGVEAPPEHLVLDVPKLAAYLADKIDGLGAEFTVEKFKGGQSNPTYKLTSADRTYVLRRRPPGQLLASAHAIDREYKVMEAVGRVGYPAPKTYHYCADEGVIGSSFYVVSFNPGRVFWEPSSPGLSPAERASVYDDMNARLAELHGLDYQAIGLGDFAKIGGYTARNLARWSGVYEQTKMIDIPDMDWLIKTLPERAPTDERIRLIHGDYGLTNVIITPEAPKIGAVLDWEMATLGDPFVDLCHHLRPWWEPADDTGAYSSLQGFDLEALGVPSMDAYIDAYCRRLGLGEMPHRNFYLGFAQFRYGAMIQGILKRAASGTAANRTVLHRQDRVQEIAALARRTLEGEQA